MTIFKGEIEVEDFRKAIEGICNLSFEPLMMIREDGIHFKEISRGSIYMELDIHKDNFQRYEYEGDMDITLSGTLFLRAIRTIKGALLIRTDGDKIRIKESDSSKIYEFALLVNDTTREFPKTLPEGGLSKIIPTEIFKEMLSGADSIYSSSDNKKVLFKVGDGITFHAGTYDNIAKFIYKVSKDKIDEEFVLAYDLDFIKHVTVVLTSETITVGFRKDYPLLIEFDGEAIKGKFIVAPIEEGD